MDTPPSALDRINRWIRDSVSVKLLSMGLLTLLLLIPSALIRNLINERNDTRSEAVAEVQHKWGSRQQLTGPILIVPYQELHVTDDDTIVEQTHYAYFLPESLDVDGAISTDVLYRGIYEVIVYNSTLTISGNFARPNFTEWPIEEDRILWQDAVLAIGIAQPQGVTDTVTLHWQDDQFAFDAGVESQDVLVRGMSVRVPLHGEGPYSYRFDLGLNGSEALNFAPVGKETTVRLASAWTTPSFDGAFLPDNRIVSKDGFTANWHVLDLNRSYPQKWRNEIRGIHESAFGVTLLVPVDQYQKSLRAAKYAILVIVFTFLTFFLVEVHYDERAHPFQYLLIGFALCLFYTLLVALSEQISFDLAYLLSALATIGLIAAYVRSVFQARHLSLVTGGVLGVLYGFVFFVLQLEDYALLAGSIGLLVALALTMFLTRSVNWFATGSG